MNVTVIGAGTMGNGIAHTFAQKGNNVFLYDTNETQLALAIKTIGINLDRQVKGGKISEHTKNETLKNIQCTSSLAQASEGATLVVEAIVENLEIKKSLFMQLNNLVREDTILASNTSSISISTLALASSRPDCVIGMHFFNPVPIMTLVEIIIGKRTSEQTLSRVKSIVVELDKTPILVNDFPGFISNRVLMPMINEAILALEEGVAEVEAIDQIMKLGMAHPMGPLQLADFIGLDVCLNIMNVLHDGFKSDKYLPAGLLVKMVELGQLGKKSGKGFYSYN